MHKHRETGICPISRKAPFFYKSAVMTIDLSRLWISRANFGRGGALPSAAA
jgi:hypothetical protein